MKLVLRVMHPSDIPAVCQIIRQNYTPRFATLARRELAAMFGDGPIKPQYVVATIQQSVVGVAGYIQAWMDYSVYEIFWVNVAPAYQQQGIGVRLVQQVIKKIQRHKPSVILLTTTRPRFYRKLGFQLFTKLPSGYVLMGRSR